MIITEINNK